MSPDPGAEALEPQQGGDSNGVSEHVVIDPSVLDDQRLAG